MRDSVVLTRRQRNYLRRGWCLCWFVCY